MIVSYALAICAVSLPWAAATPLPRAVPRTAPNTTPGEYIYIWSGVEGRNAPDRLLTLDFNRTSPSYGSLLAQTPVSTSGNEPHHCGQSHDGQTLLCGGLLSLLKSQDAVFVFDLANPAEPRFSHSAPSQFGAVPDDFVPLADGSFLLSQMGSMAGGTPGRVVKLSANGTIMSGWPAQAPDDFNPHGLDVRPDLNLLVSCDFVDPSSTLNAVPGDMVFRSSVRIWDLAKMEIQRTVRLPSGTASMDCKLLHRDGAGRGLVGGSGSGKIYLFSPNGEYKQVIDMNELVPAYLRPFVTILAQFMQISPDDRTLYVPYVSAPGVWTGKSGYYSGVAVYDIGNPESTSLKQQVMMDKHAGPHMCRLVGDRLVVGGYFLNEDDFGKVHLDGDRTVRVFNIAQDGRLSDGGFAVDFNTVVDGVKLRPHGMGMRVVQ